MRTPSGGTFCWICWKKIAVARIEICISVLMLTKRVRSCVLVSNQLRSSGRASIWPPSSYRHGQHNLPTIASTHIKQRFRKIHIPNTYHLRRLHSPSFIYYFHSVFWNIVLLYDRKREVIRGIASQVTERVIFVTYDSEDPVSKIAHPNQSLPLEVCGTTPAENTAVMANCVVPGVQLYEEYFVLYLHIWKRFVAY